MIRQIVIHIIICFHDIKNLKNDAILKDSFTNTELFYVCQSTNLIQNSKAFNCCEYNIEDNKCDYIPPTTILETTIIDESSFLIKSTEEILSSEIEESITNTQIINDTKLLQLKLLKKLNKVLDQLQIHK